MTRKLFVMSKPVKPNFAVVVSQLFMQNTFIAWRDGNSECVVIDPGLEPGKIIDELAERKLTPVAILLTHGHADHIGGNQAMKDAYPQCPIYIGRGEADFLTDPVLNLSRKHGADVISPEADYLLDEGDVVDHAGFQFRILDTPGHSPGHIIYVCDDEQPFVFGGDVLFQGGIGRTDFPNGSFADLKSSIQDKMFKLHDETYVFTGHGDPTIIGHEKEHNYYVGLNSTFIPDSAEF